MGCVTTAFIGVLIMMLMCGGTLLAYVVFPPPPLDILVMGLDARPGEGMATRTDTIMLVGIQPARLRTALLSIPRDLFLDVPGYGMQRVNTVNVLAEVEQDGTGPRLLQQTIQANFGVTPDRYVRLNFDGFRELIDAVGGIDIYVERNIVDPTFPVEDGSTTTVEFQSGWQHMNGERALQYARTRYGDDDYGRAGRQQQVVSALGARMINPLNWAPALAVLSRSMDTNVSPIDLVVMAPPLLLSAGRYEQLVIDRDYIQGTAAGYAVPDYAKLDDWVQSNFD